MKLGKNKWNLVKKICVNNYVIWSLNVLYLYIYTGIQGIPLD